MSNPVNAPPAVVAVPASGPGAAPSAAAAPVAPPPNTGGAADSRNAVVPPPRPARNPRRVLGSSSTAQIVGAPPLLTLVANQPSQTIRRMVLNYYVPVALSLFIMLDILDRLMIRTYRFMQSSGSWSPLSSRSYIGVLFFVQAMRARETAGCTERAEQECLDWFSLHFDFRNLMIPGPLVPFFQAITTSAAPFEWFNDIAPRLFDTGSWNAAADYLYPDSLYWCLPNVALMIDQLQWIRDTATSTSAQVFSNLFSVAATATADVRMHMASPDARHRVHMTQQQFDVMKTHLAMTDLPPSRLDANDTDTDSYDWLQILRLVDTDESRLGWFDEFSGTMQTYCKFFENSVPLSAISPSGLGASIPVWKFVANARLSKPYRFTSNTYVPNPPQNPPPPVNTAMILLKS